ncbi:fructose-1,6-bisphosphatase [Aerococcus sp. YH-aer221]|uniref:fructose-1,6-bisphosphatase n=1 Tax=Aerococcus kribbianus TaxID=2999064 RepID=UPI00228596F3|nr:fructose-1,6-bisphosphatase [Aerococcus sp. YH-aer221]MCZ0716949.1 fructose-1,6-bisphosphatase [Aerococcus sp. YH-aer221]
MSQNLRYLQLLSQKFPDIPSVTTEIINLEAIMELPKATEHYLSDLHGEYDAVSHVLRNGSGNIKEKIREVFQERLTKQEINQLATIVYYPQEKLQVLTQDMTDGEKQEFFTTTISELVELGQFVVSKYTRSKVRKAMPKDMAYIMEELLFKDSILSNKEDYYHDIINNVISLGAADRLIQAFSQLIQELVVDHLHVLGDIYDRGPAPDKIIDLLMKKKSLDIQWGNHDIIWMGAASGSRLLLANVVRICARYDNLNIIEDAYGISLRPLLSFAEKVYRDADLNGFMPKIDPDLIHLPEESKQIARMHMAIAMIQFKMEKAVIDRHPEFQTDDRLLLDKIDYDKFTITIDGKVYPLENHSFPTVDPNNPYQLTEEEEWVMEKLQAGFLNSEKLQKHIAFLYSKGSLYKVYNDNLLYHGCIPMNPDGSFMTIPIAGENLSGQALFEKFEQILRQAYKEKGSKENPCLDYVWYLWQGEGSTLFGKEKMTTFERYFVVDKETHEEYKNIYYEFRNHSQHVESILCEFGVDPQKGHIVNGHTPVKERKGENPIKADGKLLVIDGGFSKAYQKTTGLAGYTLLYNSFGMQLVTHQPFSSIEDAVVNEKDIVSTRRVVDKELDRMTVRQTDVGIALEEQVIDLKDLLNAYRNGTIKPYIK